MDFGIRNSGIRLIFPIAGLAVLLAVVVYLGYRSGQTAPEPESAPVQPGAEQTTETETATKLLPYRPEIPVRKRQPVGEGRMEYVLEGSFPEGLAPQPRYRTSDGRLGGQFIFREDPLKREIPVVMGISGQVMFGRCEGSLAGTCRWSPLANIELVAEIKAGEAVKLKVIEAVDDNFPELAGMIDGIYREYEKGEFNLEIPEGFSLYAEAVGVVR